MCSLDASDLLNAWFVLARRHLKEKKGLVKLQSASLVTSFFMAIVLNNGHYIM
jgi:hypothetical protein